MTGVMIDGWGPATVLMPGQTFVSRDEFGVKLFELTCNEYGIVRVVWTSEYGADLLATYAKSEHTGLMKCKCRFSTCRAYHCLTCERSGPAVQFGVTRCRH